MLPTLTGIFKEKPFDRNISPAGQHPEALRASADAGSGAQQAATGFHLKKHWIPGQRSIYLTKRCQWSRKSNSLCNSHNSITVKIKIKLEKAPTL